MRGVSWEERAARTYERRAGAYVLAHHPALVRRDARGWYHDPRGERFKSKMKAAINAAEAMGIDETQCDQMKGWQG